VCLISQPKPHVAVQQLLEISWPLGPSERTGRLPLRLYCLIKSWARGSPGLAGGLSELHEALAGVVIAVGSF
jgi:hypothetical protein